MGSRGRQDHVPVGPAGRPGQRAAGVSPAPDGARRLDEPERPVGLRHPAGAATELDPPDEAGRGPRHLGRQDPRSLLRRVGAVGRREGRRHREPPLVPPHGRDPGRLERASGCCCTSGRSTGRRTSTSTASWWASTGAATTRSRFDITDALKDRGPQEITVAVWDPTDAGTQPRGKQVQDARGIWYTPVTGIWQTVWLEPVPEASIAGLEIDPRVDREEICVDRRGSWHDRPARGVGGGPGRAARRWPRAEGRAGERLRVRIDDAEALVARRSVPLRPGGRAAPIGERSWTP